MSLRVSLVMNSRYLVYCIGNEFHNEFPCENFNIFFELRAVTVLHQV